MTIICPAVLAATPASWSRQLKRAASTGQRIHIDLADGQFAQPATLDWSAADWSGLRPPDVHLMHNRPADLLKAALDRQPLHLIWHAESQTDHLDMAARLHAGGVGAGLALLPATSPEQVRHLLPAFDLVLVFGGRLGAQSVPGSTSADLTHLVKAAELRRLGFHGELAWDGGVNPDNIGQIVSAGFQVIISGGFLQSADDAAVAYDQLAQAAARRGR